VALAAEPADPASTSPEAHAHATQLRDRARAVVDALAPELREAFVLAEAHGLTPAEVGQVQGVPPATARTRLHRARTRIRTALEGDTR
jgi:RNA polymerase sigma-70 factor (ECF subfamily)